MTAISAQKIISLDSLEQSSLLLAELLASPRDKTAPDDLTYTACEAGLFGYALPKFRDEYSDVEAA